LDLEFTPDELAFREEARRFIAEHYPAEIRRKQAAGEEFTKEDYLGWHRALANKGWVAPAWPIEYGGSGWSAVQRYLWAEELGRADAMTILPFGVSMVGPVIYTFGTPEQKERWLPQTLSGDIWWCQGYSEPGAGSDLASLKTRAVRDGDHYVVNGQKTWTTLAQFADWGFFLVRTDPDAKPQQGISFLLIDMKSPGVSVRPIITMDGAHEVNEVWLEDVRVPIENRIFHENQGWTCAKFLLAHERAGIARVAQSKAGLTALRTLSGSILENGRPLAEDPFFRRKLSELEIELMSLEFTELRLLAAESAGQGLGAQSSLLKIKGAEIQQRLTELAVEAAGPHILPHGAPKEGSNQGLAAPYARDLADTYFNTRKVSIYGGSNEIQRNIIAKAVLGL
jgi:alkylation response protein AidB-like acyl-CoA dehydrogenase